MPSKTSVTLTSARSVSPSGRPLDQPVLAQPVLRARWQRVGAELTAHLEKLIALGDLRPGDKLPSERDLAAEFGVSRASLRDAMHELEAKHLIERTPGRGTTVLPAPSHVNYLYSRISDEQHQLRDIAELREALEPRLAQLAALRATPANLIELQELLVTPMAELTKAESVRVDLEFHLAVARASQNPLMASINALVGSWTAATPVLSHSTRHAREVSHRGHLEIFQALHRQDDRAAHEAMTRHLLDVSDLTLANYTRAGRNR